MSAKNINPKEQKSKKQYMWFGYGGYGGPGQPNELQLASSIKNPGLAEVLFRIFNKRKEPLLKDKEE